MNMHIFDYTDETRCRKLKGMTIVVVIGLKNMDKNEVYVYLSLFFSCKRPRKRSWQRMAMPRIYYKSRLCSLTVKSRKGNVIHSNWNVDCNNLLMLHFAYIDTFLSAGVISRLILPCQHYIQGWIGCQDQWWDIHRQGRLPSCLQPTNNENV